VAHRLKLAHTVSMSAGCHALAVEAGWMKTRSGRSAPRSQRARRGAATFVTSAAAATGVVGCALAFTPRSAALTYTGINTGIERRMLMNAGFGGR
jgi:hypothetical protein